MAAVPSEQFLSDSEIDLHSFGRFSPVPCGKIGDRGGYDCEFVEPPPAAFQTDCPICLHVLKEPCLISCPCGQKICRECVEQIKEDDKPCPLCNKTDFTYIRDYGLERYLKAQEVVDLVRDGLNDTMPEFGEDTNRGESITDAWDFVQENVVDLVRDGLNDTMPEFGEDTNRGESITDAWDFVQENLECCGVNNYTDWADDPNVNSYPASCCSNDPVVNASSNLPPCSLTNVYRDFTFIYAFPQGCEDALTSFIRDNLLVVASVAITFVVAEVIVVLMAICLLCCTDFD
ncbi:Tetraspanin-7 [Geodia barretti]|uniref:Tetraspanin-7 n=1 Tax=Geodia barretti TaxID=519541 RepID=A0AA35SEC9_GEOBA|nr:Tetraspanin-7 [Geodia barretti]